MVSTSSKQVKLWGDRSPFSITVSAATLRLSELEVLDLEGDMDVPAGEFDEALFEVSFHFVEWYQRVTVAADKAPNELAVDALDVEDHERFHAEHVVEFVLADDFVQVQDLQLLGAQELAVVLQLDAVALGVAGSCQAGCVEGQAQRLQVGKLAGGLEVRVAGAVVVDAAEPVELRKADGSHSAPHLRHVVGLGEQPLEVGHVGQGTELEPHGGDLREDALDPAVGIAVGEKGLGDESRPAQGDVATLKGLACSADIDDLERHCGFRG